MNEHEKNIAEFFVKVEKKEEALDACVRVTCRRLLRIFIDVFSLPSFAFAFA